MKIKPVQAAAIISRLLSTGNIEQALAEHGIDVGFFAELLAIEARDVLDKKRDGSSERNLDARYRHIIDTLMKLTFHKETSSIQSQAAENYLENGNAAVMEELKSLLNKNQNNQDK